MTDEDKAKQGCHYLVVVEFRLDAEGISEDEPAGKVYLRGRYDLSKYGQKEFNHTLATFFEQVTLIIVDLAKRLSRSKLIDS